MKNNFIIAADTHGLLDINKVVNYFDGHENKYSKDDFLIICRVHIVYCLQQFLVDERTFFKRSCHFAAPSYLSFLRLTIYLSDCLFFFLVL